MSEPWHLDTRVPLALLLTIGLQTAGVVWWAAGMSARMDQSERVLAAIVQREAATMSEMRRASELLARIEERMGHQTDALRRLERHFYAPARDARD